MIQEIKRAMGELLVEEGLESLALLLRIRENWREVVGEELADKTIPYRLEEGRLFVGVYSHSTAQDLHFREGAIKDALSGILGTKVKRIVAKKVTLK